MTAFFYYDHMTKKRTTVRIDGKLPYKFKQIAALRSIITEKKLFIEEVESLEREKRSGGR